MSCTCIVLSCIDMFLCIYMKEQYSGKICTVTKKINVKSITSLWT